MKDDQPAGGVRTTEIVAVKEQVAAFAPCAINGFFAVQGHAVFIVAAADVVAFARRAVADTRKAFAGVCIDGIVLVQGLFDERVLCRTGIALRLFDLGDVVSAFCGGCGQRSSAG